MKCGMTWFIISQTSLAVPVWCLRMNKSSHPVHYNGRNYLLMLGLKLIHVSESRHRYSEIIIIAYLHIAWLKIKNIIKSGPGNIRSLFQMMLTESHYVQIWRKVSNQLLWYSEWRGWHSVTCRCFYDNTKEYRHLRIIGVISLQHCFMVFWSVLFKVILCIYSRNLRACLGKRRWTICSECVIIWYD